MNATPQEENARQHKERAAALLSKGKIEPALKEYELSVQILPRDVVARRKVAELLARLGRVPEAVAAYQALIGRFAAEGRLLEAIALCKCILQLDPLHRETQAALARLYARRDGDATHLERLPKSMSGSVDMTYARAARTMLPKPRLGLPGRDEMDLPDTTGPMELIGEGGRGASVYEGASPKPASVRGIPPPDAKPPSMRGISLPEAEPLRPSKPASISNAPTSPGAGRSTSPGMSSAPGIDIDTSELPVTPLFSELPELVMHALLEKLTMIPFLPGENILVEGEIGDSLFVLASGAVDVVRNDAQGNRQVVDKMEAGAFFGEIGLVADVPRLATVVATEDCMVLEVTREVIAGLSIEFPFLQELVRGFYKERLLSNLLRSSPIFVPLSESERKQVVEKFGIRFAQPGEAILTQGEGERGLFLLLRGTCAVSYRDVTGDEHPLPEMHEGAVMGEISLINGTAVTATVTAKTPVVLLFLEAGAFVEHLLSNPESRKLITKLSDERLKRTEALEQRTIERSFL